MKQLGARGARLGAAPHGGLATALEHEYRVVQIILRVLVVFDFAQRYFLLALAYRRVSPRLPFKLIQSSLRMIAWEPVKWNSIVFEWLRNIQPFFIAVDENQFQSACPVFFVFFS